LCLRGLPLRVERGDFPRLLDLREPAVGRAVGSAKLDAQIVIRVLLVRHLARCSDEVVTEDSQAVRSGDAGKRHAQVFERCALRLSRPYSVCLMRRVATLARSRVPTPQVAGRLRCFGFAGSRQFATAHEDHGDHHAQTDRLFRIPPLPPPSQPVDEHYDLWFDDGYAPEFVLDSLNEAPVGTALKHLGVALACIAGAYGLAVFCHNFVRTPREVPNKQYPYDNLRVEFGGPDGSPNRGLPKVKKAREITPFDPEWKPAAQTQAATS